MTPFNCNMLADYGANDELISLFKNLIEKEMLQTKESRAVYKCLSENLIEIPYDEYNIFTLASKVSLPYDAYYKRFHQLQLKCLDKGDRSWDDLFPNLITLIQKFSECPTELTAFQLYRDFDFEDVLSFNHDPDEGYSPKFFEGLSSSNFDKQAFHAFALFACFTSNNPHLVQNFLMALCVVPGPIPFELLNVLGRYDAYNLTSYALIDRVSHLSKVKREDLIFTHLKSMDIWFHYERPEKLESKKAKYWASLNTSSDVAAQNFHDEMLGLEPNHNLIFAALGHYNWCISKLLGKTVIDADSVFSLTKLERAFHDYLCKHLGLIETIDSHAIWMKHHYRKLWNVLDASDVKLEMDQVKDNIFSLLDLLVEIFSRPEFDDIVTRLAPELADHEASYYSFLRPSSHRYDLFLEVKIMAADVWFPRELKRIQSGDSSNWGTFSLTLRNGNQFNVLSIWLLEIIGKGPISNSKSKPLGFPLVQFLDLCLSLYPDTSELRLHTRRLFGLILSDKEPRLIKRVILILRRQKQEGYEIPFEIELGLKGLNRESLSRLHARMVEKLLETDNA